MLDQAPHVLFASVRWIREKNQDSCYSQTRLQYSRTTVQAVARGWWTRKEMFFNGRGAARSEPSRLVGAFLKWQIVSQLFFFFIAVVQSKVRRLLDLWWSTCKDTCRSEQEWVSCRCCVLKSEVFFCLGLLFCLWWLYVLSDSSHVWPLNTK